MRNFRPGLKIDTGRIDKTWMRLKLNDAKKTREVIQMYVLMDKCAIKNIAVKCGRHEFSALHYDSVAISMIHCGVRFLAPVRINNTTYKMYR